MIKKKHHVVLRGLLLFKLFHLFLAQRIWFNTLRGDYVHLVASDARVSKCVWIKAEYTLHLSDLWPDWEQFPVMLLLPWISAAERWTQREVFRAGFSSCLSLWGIQLLWTHAALDLWGRDASVQETQRGAIDHSSLWKSLVLRTGPVCLPLCSSSARVSDDLKLQPSAL